MTHFYTNIDCCKQYVARINERRVEARPLVGDYFEVYSAPQTSVLLAVATRTWKGGELYVELGLTPHWAKLGIPAFDEWVTNKPRYEERKAEEAKAAYRGFVDHKKEKKWDRCDV